MFYSIIVWAVDYLKTLSLNESAGKKVFVGLPWTSFIQIIWSNLHYSES
jgi:hypothetical protein